MNITTVGVDLAKNLFQVHGVNEDGQCCLQEATRARQGRSWCGPCRAGTGARCQHDRSVARKRSKMNHAL